MFRYSIALVTLVLFACATALAADKEVMGTLVKVDVEKNLLTVKTADGEKNYDVNEKTKFIGPKGGVSENGIKDKRLVKGVELKLIVAGNNRTLREVHIPEKSK
jgi:hypothetical protein